MHPTSAPHTPSWLKTSKGPSPASLCAPTRLSGEAPPASSRASPWVRRRTQTRTPAQAGAPDETAALQLDAGAPGGGAGAVPRGLCSLQRVSCLRWCRTCGGAVPSAAGRTAAPHRPELQLKRYGLEPQHLVRTWPAANRGELQCHAPFRAMGAAGSAWPRVTPPVSPVVAVTKPTDRCLKHNGDLLPRWRHLLRAFVMPAETQVRVFAGPRPLHRLRERILWPCGGRAPRAPGCGCVTLSLACVTQPLPVSVCRVPSSSEDPRPRSV